MLKFTEVGKRLVWDISLKKIIKKKHNLTWTVIVHSWEIDAEQAKAPRYFHISQHGAFKDILTFTNSFFSSALDLWKHCSASFNCLCIWESYHGAVAREIKCIVTTELWVWENGLPAPPSPEKAPQIQLLAEGESGGAAHPY